MGLFGKKNNDDKSSNTKITDEDEKRMKTRSQNLHDPILDAMNEAQPFEDSNMHNRNSSIGNGILTDIFGAKIINPDISNPTRSRDERPLDTIRSFEYSITGDPIYHEQLESHILGWRVRDDFNNNNANNNYNNQVQYDEYGQPIYTNNNNNLNNNNNQYVEQGVYTAPERKIEVEKKKGFFSFGKKKKNTNSD